VAANENPEKGNRTLSCEAWEAMLTDALDGTLTAADSAAFTAHSDGCLACADLLEEATRGSEWLQFLRQAPAAPLGLVERILAGTSGLPEAGPLVAAGVPAAIPQQPWLGMHMLQRGVISRHMAESRILMTLAMAFFSIALTLNLTGVHLNQLRLADLKPTALASAVSHQYFATSKNVQRYYSNLRLVYEVESRLNEIRQGDGRSAPAGSPAPQPSPREAQPVPLPRPQATRPAGKNGGSARRDAAPAIVPSAPMRRTGPPVLAQFLRNPYVWSMNSPQATLRVRTFALLYPGNIHPQSERSLV
jgi:hypothetical protein